MMKDINDALKDLESLYKGILARPLIAKGSTSWAQALEGSEEAMGKHGVYILWATTDGIKSGNPPVYVGEGQIGKRMWTAFSERSGWTHAQMLPVEVKGEDREERFLQKALERVCILALDPVQNVD